MNFKELVEHLLEKYKEDKCRYIIKGGNELSLVIKRRFCHILFLLIIQD